MKIFNKAKISLLMPILISLSSLKCDDLNLERDKIDEFILMPEETKVVEYYHYHKKVSFSFRLNRVYFNNHEDIDLASVSLMADEDTSTYTIKQGMGISYRPFRDALGTREIKLESINGTQTIGFRDDKAYFSLWKCDYCP